MTTTEKKTIYHACQNVWPHLLYCIDLILKKASSVGKTTATGLILTAQMTAVSSQVIPKFEIQHFKITITNTKWNIL